ANLFLPQPRLVERVPADHLALIELVKFLESGKVKPVPVGYDYIPDEGARRLLLAEIPAVVSVAVHLVGDLLRRQRLCVDAQSIGMACPPDQGDLRIEIGS